MVGNEFTLLRKTHRVNAVALKYIDCNIGYYGDKHQRHQQVIAPCYFSNEEYEKIYNDFEESLKYLGITSLSH